MKKIFTLILLSIHFLSFSQNDFDCGFDQARTILQNQDSNWLQNYEYYIQQLLLHKSDLKVPEPLGNGGKLNKTEPSPQARFIIPVVVQVLHRQIDSIPGMVSNITDAQIQHQLSILNKAFRNASQADSNAVNTGIQFCLASRDKNGNSTSGIIRKSSDSLSLFKFANKLATPEDTLFPEELFLNIYIVYKIIDAFGVPMSIKGIGLTSLEFEGDGIVMVYDWFGDSATCGNCPLVGPSNGNVLVHEAGHYFGLEHTFRGGCSDSTSATCATTGDLCCDTPPVSTANRNCNEQVNSCNEQNDRPDMLSNYMDYSLECANTFTKDQTDLMHAYITSYRELLIEANNVAKTGANTCNYHTALFSADKKLVCDSGWVKFEALDKNLAYIWTIKNGLGDTLFSGQQADTLLFYFNSINEYNVELITIHNSDTMQMSRIAIVKVANCGTPIVSTQGNWYFGDYAGIKFTQGGAFRDMGAYVGPIGPTLAASEGTITWSNKNGQLLFYGGSSSKDGLYKFMLFNSQYDTLKGGHLPAHDYGSSVQSGIVVPHPLDSNKVYVLVNEAYGVAMNESGLHYSLIDLTGDNGLGEVILSKKNQAIKGASSIPHSIDSAIHTGEGMTVIPACNGSDHWLITTDYYNYYINLFLIHDDTIEWKNRIEVDYHTNFYSSLTASPDGTKLACRGGILNFNRSNGQITEFASSPLPTHHHCFSENSKVLYLLNNGTILQMNIYQNNMVTKFVGKTPNNKGEAMQLGPDGKIYIVNYKLDYVSVINSPNNLISDNNPNACGFQPLGVDLSEVGNEPIGKSGVPNIITAKKIEELPLDFNYIATNCKTVKFSTANYCADSYKWIFDDGNTSTFQNPQHTYAQEDTYNVSLVVDGDTITKSIKLEVNIPDIVGNIDVCDTTEIQFYSLFNSNPADQYTWSITSGNGSIVLSNQNEAQIKWSSGGTIRVSIIGDNGCSGYKDKNIAIAPPIDSNILLHTQNYYCGSDSIEIVGNTPTGGNGVYTYVWQKSTDSINWTTVHSSISKNHIEYNPSTNLFFRRIAKSSNCTKLSNVSKVLITKPVNIVSAKTPNNPNCYYGANGSEPAIIANDIRYKWYVSHLPVNAQEFTNFIHNPKDTLKDFSYPNSAARSDLVFKTYRIIQYNNCFDTSNIATTYQSAITDHPANHNSCNHPWGYFFTDGKVTNQGNNHVLWQRKTKITNSWNTITDTTYGYKSFYYKYYLGSNIKGDSIRFLWINNFGSCADTQYSRSAVIKTDTAQPVIQTILTDVTVDEFVTVMYAVYATNAANADYYWQVKAQGTNYWSPLNNNSSSLNISPVEFCQNGNSYRVIVSNACGSDTSNTSLLTVNQTIMGLWYDVWMKDNTKDTAAEPNTFVDPANITLDVYRSPDIWNCKDNSSCGSHENAEFKYNSPNYVQVKVRNKGPNQSAYDNLRVYWTHCSTGEIWDESWIGTDKNRFWNADSGKYYPYGGEISGINGYQINNLDAGDSVIVSFAWYPPNPKWYYTAKGTVKTYESSSCVCLLARLEQCNNYPFGMTYPEKFGLKIQDNVIKNNNIITKNIAVLDEINGNFKVKSEWTGIGRVMNDCDSFEILLKPESSSFFDDWIVEVILDDTISKIWFAGGEQGSGFTILDSNRLLVDENEQFAIRNICLKKDQMAFVAVEFTAKDTTNNIPVKVYDVALWQQELNNGPDSYQGGFVYRIDNSNNQLNSSGYSFKRKILNNTEKNEINFPLNWRFYPNPTEKNLVVEFNSNFNGLATIQVFDVYGKLLIDQKTEMHKGENKSYLDLLSVASGTYFIKLRTNELAKSNKFFIQR